MENQKIAPLFEGDSNISPDERVRIANEFQKMGSMPTFKIYKNEEGWMAQCNEITGIIAGGTNPNPTEFEIVSQIREAIFAAFNVEVKESPYFSFRTTEEPSPNSLTFATGN